jgi:ribosomal protein S18 acetylase RimI-like enzyme
VLRALPAHGRVRGATGAYLGVVASNSAARALYAKEGFTVSGGYHYRVR